MCKKTDFEIIYDCYIQIAKDVAVRKKKSVPISHDKSLINGTNNSAQKLLKHISESQNLTKEEINKKLISAKGVYMQYLQVKSRHPELITKTITSNIDRLVKTLCEYETEMLALFRPQEPAGISINLQVIFDQKKYRNRMTAMLAQTIVSDAISDPDNKYSYTTKFYITNTGKKYHRVDCPYCKGRNMTAIVPTVIKQKKLTECKCLKNFDFNKVVDHNFVTAFVDESIHRVIYDSDGVRNGLAGSFSYIICFGNLKDETEINEHRIIAQGIDSTSECTHLERITELAIGKVMISLLYDYGFTGPIRIITDNQPVVNKWRDIEGNCKLASAFESVSIEFTPRESNKRADELGRTRMLLDMPISCYNELNTILQEHESLVISDMTAESNKVTSIATYTKSIPFHIFISRVCLTIRDLLNSFNKYFRAKSGFSSTS